MKIADLLSQNSLTGLSQDIFHSASTCLIHKASQIPWAKAQNGASALEQATTSCFLFCHVIRLSRESVQ